MTQTKTQTKTVVGVGLMVATIGVLGFAAGLYYYGKKVVCPKCPTCPVVKSGSSSTSSSSSASNNSNNNSSTNSGSTPTSGALPDLGFTVNTQYGTNVTGVSPSTSATNGMPSTETITIVNTGKANAGPFKVKIWFGPGQTVNNASTLAYTWDVPGLAAGQALTKKSDPFFLSGGVHSAVYLITKVDADNQIKESNEAACSVTDSAGELSQRSATVGCNTYVLATLMAR